MDHSAVNLIAYALRSEASREGPPDACVSRYRRPPSSSLLRHRRHYSEARLASLNRIDCSGGAMRGHERLNLEEVAIPEYVLNGGKASSGESRAPKWPILVFINTKSGGQLGTALLETFHKILASHQVFDLGKDRPEEVLSGVLRNLERLKAEGDRAAEKIRSSLRLVVAGGDGTAGWLLGVVGDLRLENPPPIATIPLGTGNNLPFSFGWGKKNPGTDADSVKRFLRDVVQAHPLNVDSWHVAMTMEGSQATDVDAPHSLHAFKKSPDGSKEDLQLYRGGFWNYFSMGMDAQVSYKFHKERQEHPKKFNNQLKNQCNYARIGCTQGWFTTSCVHPVSRNINEIAKVYVAERNGDYKLLEISSTIRSLVLLNLPSFSGGFDPWGNPSDKKSVERGLTIPSVNDGLLEIVGFRDGWHGLFLLFPNGHGTRLGQAHRVKIELNRAAHKDHTYIRMDGEPWKQPIPLHRDESTTIEITHHGQALMLAKKGCIAESKDAYEHKVAFTRHGIEHGLQLKPNVNLEDGDPVMAEEIDCEGDDAKRKFGAASTFKP